MVSAPHAKLLTLDTLAEKACHIAIFYHIIKINGMGITICSYGCLLYEPEPVPPSMKFIPISTGSSLLTEIPELMKC
jgi:hypothetical protein